ncbi:hypothetical protein BKI51_10325 [Alphaproteobacteria bacterium AO1-B]|nr:hypothetical protein BKI51_10325 [Alphaproteobacteria bacterium AO1-B]
MINKRYLLFFYFVLLTLIVCPVRGEAETRDERRVRNCTAYKETYSKALTYIDETKLTQEFRAAHDAFLATGCLSNIPACPIFAEDLWLADRLFMMTINANMGSTFTPFRCPGSAR